MVAGADPATGALAGVCARIGAEGRSDPGRRLGDWRAGVSSPAAPTGVTSCSARCRPPVRLLGERTILPQLLGTKVSRAWAPWGICPRSASTSGDNGLHLAP